MSFVGVAVATKAERSNFTQVQFTQVHFTDGQFTDGQAVRVIRPSFYDRVVKRPLDIALVLLSAPLTLLVVGLLWLPIMRDGGPVFYSQPRVGRNGRIFRMWKLRSMVVSAEEKLQSYLDAHPDQRREWEENQKLRCDPRITRVGRFIRKTSLDEVPQFWNVLMGDMSIVGPRPILPSQQTIYPGTAYYALRPGITGLWQISARNESSFAQRARFDQRYLAKLSLKTDLAVMLRTVRVIFRGTGC